MDLENFASEPLAQVGPAKACVTENGIGGLVDKTGEERRRMIGVRFSGGVYFSGFFNLSLVRFG